MIKKILVANRGEIAVRVMRSCYEMGIRTVAVYSEADRTCRHVLYADEAECIGPASSRDSYLCMDRILAAAKKHGAEAIHPGYGFLSENAEFASRCRDEGLVFIGPEPDTIIRMGDKIQARATMIAAGVPVIPGVCEKLNSPSDVVEACNGLGYPVIIKAARGGGGKGMRVARDASEVVRMYEDARSEALSSFGDDTVYIEKYMENPHHIEFQILGDRQGNVIHLFDRECSVQRRHQKIVEESPSPFLDSDLRRRMGEAAVTAAKYVGYEGAGTVEFLVDKDRNFYFLEMNTRLQVEHPVTEEVCGIDLVKQQILIADGQGLAYAQEDVKQRGCAIECRICAEDTDNGFRPSPGLIRQLTEPQGQGIRIDSAAYQGYEMPMYYDPMIGKLIVWAARREYAIERMRRALYEYKMTGLMTNIRYLRHLIDAPQFKEGVYDTSFTEQNQERLKKRKGYHNESEDIAAIAAYIDYLMNFEENSSDEKDESALSRWRAFGLQKGVLRV
ncbi:MAG: acetyl-CoA carboxylase biotin carboxylase subunit [Bacteroidales bacterium]|nr:acetyl-CoA carboxylase biotin carboxylase subunit [Bacteroidales bacterium]